MRTLHFIDDEDIVDDSYMDPDNNYSYKKAFLTFSTIKDKTIKDCIETLEDCIENKLALVSSLDTYEDERQFGNDDENVVKFKSDNNLVTLHNFTVQSSEFDSTVENSPSVDEILANEDMPTILVQLEDSPLSEDSPQSEDSPHSDDVFDLLQSSDMLLSTTESVALTASDVSESSSFSYAEIERRLSEHFGSLHPHEVERDRPRSVSPQPKSILKNRRQEKSIVSAPALKGRSSSGHFTAILRRMPTLPSYGEPLYDCRCKRESAPARVNTMNRVRVKLRANKKLRQSLQMLENAQQRLIKTINSEFDFSQYMQLINLLDRQADCLNSILRQNMRDAALYYGKLFIGVLAVSSLIFFGSRHTYRRIWLNTK